MSPQAKYYVRTVLLGLLGVPLMVSMSCALIGLVALEAGADVLPLIWALVVLLTQIPLWRRWSRVQDLPEHWGKALVPVVAAPALYLLAWVVTFGVTGQSWGTTLELTPFTHTLYGPLVFVILFVGPPQAMPLVLGLVLLGSVGGFLLGCRRRLADAPGRRWLDGILAAVLALVATAGGQVAVAAENARLLADGTQVSQEVDLGDYRPFSGSAKLVTPDSPPSLVISENFPVLDGATAAYPIYAAMGQAMYRIPENSRWEDFVDHYLTCSNTSGGYQRLIDGDADVFFGAQPSTRQQEVAAAAGKKLDLTPIGREAFVLFVNADNPVSSLTTTQVQDIYSRRITNWKQVGGRDEQIIPFQRPEDSGSQTVMQARVMQGQPMAAPLRDEQIDGMGGILSEVAEYRNSTAAIGYSFRWYATVMNGNPGIRLLAIDGVAPTPENIRNGSYPYAVEVYAVTAGTTNPNAAKVVDWVVSDEGQALIEKVGYVGLR
jgi:phosphate transport system substrate-binding protein